MSTTGKVIGPGGSSKSAKSTGCNSVGPGGISDDKNRTTKRGYENNRTTGLRTNYKVTGNANNSKA